MGSRPCQAEHGQRLAEDRARGRTGRDWQQTVTGEAQAEMGSRQCSRGQLVSNRAEVLIEPLLLSLDCTPITIQSEKARSACSTQRQAACYRGSCRPKGSFCTGGSAANPGTLCQHWCGGKHAQPSEARAAI